VATIQLTFPEKTKIRAAAALAEKAISCLMAFKRVRVSFMINPRTARMITLRPAPNNHHRSPLRRQEGMPRVHSWVELFPLPADL